MTIDYTKPVTTRNGQKVEIITSNARCDTWKVMGYVGDSLQVDNWQLDGKYSHTAEESEFDLVQKQELWVNVYEGNYARAFLSKKHAEETSKTPPTIARIRVEYTPGQFDE